MEFENFCFKFGESGQKKFIMFTFSIINIFSRAFQIRENILRQIVL